MGSVAGGVQQQLAFSREDEQEGRLGRLQDHDRRGLPTPGVGAQLPAHLEDGKLHGRATPRFTCRTHPTGPQRMEAMSNMTRTWRGKATNYDNSEFLRIQTRLIALYRPRRTRRKRCWATAA